MQLGVGNRIANETDFAKLPACMTPQRMIWLAPFLSGIALILALPPFHQGDLGWVALAPLLLAWRLSVTARKHAFLFGYLFGLTYFGGTFWWIGYVTVAGTSALVAYLAVYPALWFWLIQHWFPADQPGNSRSNLFQAAVIASLWVTIEWWRGWFLTGFGWNNLGTTQHETLPILQWAAFGGVHLISWFLAFVSAIIALALHRFEAEMRGKIPKRPHGDVALALLLVVICFAYGLHLCLAPLGEPIRSLRYACVQPNIPQSVKYQERNTSDILKKHLDLTAQARLADPDLVVWPETATGQGVFTDLELNAAVMKLSDENRFYFLLGAEDVHWPKIYNSAFLFAPHRQAFDVYHKNRLVIFGEYTPLVRYFPFMRYLVPSQIDFSSGDRPGLFDLAGLGLKTVPLICFEDSLPEFVREACRSHPDFLINITNDAWFEDSPGAEQHLANAVFRTVELDLPLLRCTNSGVTCEISPRGRVRNVLQDEQGHRVEVSGVLNGIMPIYESKPTPYQKWGDWIVLLSALLSGTVLIQSILRKR